MSKKLAVGMMKSSFLVLRLACGELIRKERETYDDHGHVLYDFMGALKLFAHIGKEGGKMYYQRAVMTYRHMAEKSKTDALAAEFNSIADGETDEAKRMLLALAKRMIVSERLLKEVSEGQGNLDDFFEMINQKIEQYAKET